MLGERLPGADTRRLVMVTGARQVGKTTLAQATYAGLRYLNLDAVEIREALASVPTARWARDIGPAVLDEAHKEPLVFEKLKYAYDAGELDFSAVLGSAQILMLESVRETLAGRVFLYELWPLTIGELAAEGDSPKMPLLVDIVNHGDGIADVLENAPAVLLADDDARRVAAVNHLATWGGMPELVRLDEIDRRDWLRSYHDTYLQRDLADLVRLRDLNPFLKLQRLTALRVGGLLSFSELARDAGTSPTTARNYLEYLRISYQSFLLQPFHENLTSAVVKSPKVYWSDTGILRHLGGFWGAMSGELFENLVIAETVKLIRTVGLDAEPYFYRTRSGMEVDLVLRTPAGVLGFEIKNRERTAPADLRSMTALAAALGDRFLGGIVVTRGGTIRALDDDRRFWSVPIHRLYS